MIAVHDLDVIILSGAVLAGYRTDLQALLPVPVVDGIEAAAWQALAMAHMQASKATTGGFSRVHQREVTGLAPSLVRHMAE